MARSTSTRPQHRCTARRDRAVEAGSPHGVPAVRGIRKADEEEQSAIAQRVCQFLTVHAQIEEELLYPEAKEAFDGDEENEDLMNEAEVEHGSVKELIAKIEGMSSGDDHFKATVTVLGEYIKHHVKEEETELFPQLKKPSSTSRISAAGSRTAICARRGAIWGSRSSNLRSRASARQERRAAARHDQGRAAAAPVAVLGTRNGQRLSPSAKIAKFRNSDL